MAATVTFDGTRVNDSTTGGSPWGNWGSGGGAPSSEPQLAYQGGGAVNTQVKTTALDGIDLDPGSPQMDMTAAAFPLWFVKTIVSDSFDLNTAEGVRIGIGSSNSANQLYNVAGTNANRPSQYIYPAQGGYLILAINPNVSAWIEVDNTATVSAIDWYGVQCAMVTGGAKSENLALDAIDVGRGLYIVGTAVDGSDLIAYDQDIVNNRYGVVVGSAAQMVARGLITWGRDSGGTAQVTGTDESSMTFPDGYHGAGDFGNLIDLATASTDIIFDGLYISNGVITTEDTRADFVFSGTAGAGKLTGTIVNHRNVTLTSAAEIDGATIECQLLTQATAQIQNAIIQTNSLTSVACLQDPTFHATTGLHDTVFVQAGAGHAVEIDTPGEYDFTNLVFNGYGADTTDSAAVDVTTTGAVTINYSGTVPTYKTAGSGNVTLVSAKSATFTPIDNGSAFTITKNSDNSLLKDVASTTGGEVVYAYDGALDGTATTVHLIIAGKEPIDFPWTIAEGTVPVSQVTDRIYSNP